MCSSDLVLEQRVPVEKQLQYFKFSDRLRKEAVPWTENDFEQFESDLYNPESTGEYKRRILSIFAVSKDVKSYRRLERYVQSPDPELTDWAYMALMESRIMLESELSEEKQIYISTGLGGKGRKLRFYLLLNRAVYMKEGQIEKEYTMQELDSMSIAERMKTNI